MPLSDLLTADRDSFRANLAIVNTTFGSQPIYLQPALQALRAEFDDKVTAHCGADFLPIATSASPVADRLSRLATAHSQQQQVIRTVFTDPIDRDAANQNSLAALKDALKKVFA
jgi:hypothetical protein